MRRKFGLLALIAALVPAAAIAANISGTRGNDTLRGTTKSDTISGKAGNDIIYGLAGNDRINGGPGKDRVFCGAGVDRVTADRSDFVARDCEVVTRPPAPAPVPRPSPAPTPTPVPTPPLGSRLNPFPLGSDYRGAAWGLRVNSVTADATNAVLTRNMFNDPPAPGNQFFMVNVSVSYFATSPPSDTPLGFFLDLGVLGSANVVYREWKQSCGVIPDDFDEFATMFTGGTIHGNICWEVPSAEVGSLVLAHDDGIFWALR